MRPDMKKLLCERPRYGGGYDKRNRGYAKNASFDEMPTKQSMSRGRHGTKEFGEFLAPLKRFIKKQVGRKWNDVFSEICEHINGYNPVQTHILEHVDGYISIKVQRVSTNESKTGFVSHGGIRPESSSWRHPLRAGELYVDPDDNIIKVAKNIVKDKPKPPPENKLKVFNRNLIGVKEEGIWYTIDLKDYKDGSKWDWWYGIDPPDKNQDNVGNAKYGHYTRIKLIDGKQYNDYLYGSNKNRWGDYFEIGVYLPWNWRGRKAIGLRENIVGHHKVQMTSKLLRQHNLKNDR
jgi:hypothetical protein